MASAVGNQATEETGRSDPVRVIVLARHPLRIEDLGLEDREEIEIVGLVRRLPQVEELVDEAEPDVVFVDTSFPESAIIDEVTCSPETS